MGFNLSRFLIVLGCVFITLSSSWAATITRNLTSGWNLVSIPVMVNTNVLTYLSTAGLNAANVRKIWTYNGGWKQWNSEVTEASSSTFVEFSPNQGYWFLMGVSDTLTLDTQNFSTRALQLNATSWALASFNQDATLSIVQSVLNSETVDANHVPENIKKIWGFDGIWKSYTSSDQSGSLTSVVPGYAYWFLVQDVDTKVVNGANPLTITPSGATAEDAVLIIGGATSLFPPDEATAKKIASMGRTRFSRFSASRLTTIAAASTSENAQMHCTGNEMVPVEIGQAEMWSVDGQLLAADPIYCGKGYNSDPANTPLTFEIKLTKDEAQVIKDKPNLAQDAIINIKLHSGQNQKTCLPKNPADDLENWNPEVPSLPIEGQRADTSSTSTLAAAMVAQEIGKRLGVPPDKFKLGEANGGLGELNSEIKSIVGSSAAEGVDVLGNMQAIMKGANDPNSALYMAKQKIESVNAVSSLTDSGRLKDRSQEIADVMAGNTSDLDMNDFAAKLDQARNVVSAVNNLFVEKRNAERKGVITSDEAGNLDEFIEKMTKAAVGSNNVLDAGSVLVNSLGMANATSGDAVLGNQTKSRACSLIMSAYQSMNAMDTSSGTTRAMELAAAALEFPQEMVALMAKNKDAGKKFATVVGTATKLLDTAESEDNSAATTGERKLDNLGNLTSKLANSKGLLTVLAQNADSSEDVSEIFGAAVGAVADSSGAAEDIMAKIGEAKTILETTSDIRVDFKQMMESSVTKVKNPGDLALILAKNAGDADAAQKILAEVASAVTPNKLKEVLKDDTLDKVYGLRRKPIADAGPVRRQLYAGGAAKIKLDARNSFDPFGSTLKYQWYRVQVDGSESAISTKSESNSEIETSIDTSAGGRIDVQFRVEVTNTEGGRGQANTKVILETAVPPVVVAPRYVVAKVNRKINIDASSSFDPERSRELRFTWEFSGSSQMQPDQSFVSVTYAEAGKYEGSLKLEALSTAGVAVATVMHHIAIKVNDSRPPVADAGYDLVLSQNEMVDLLTPPNKGLLIDNYSFSYETGDSSGLTYSWEPASYFSREMGYNSTSVNPLFIVTKPGTYDITLNVVDTNNNQSSSDEITIVIRKGLPPVAVAGNVQVVKLGNELKTVYLDGSYSFSFITPNPAYEWSGPTSFDGNSGTSAVAQITLDPNNFTTKQKLEYTLRVTDNNGSSEDTLTVLVLPSLAAPIPVVDVFPRNPFYKAGELVELDGSFSFHPEGLAIDSYEWKVLGNAQIEGNNTDQIIRLVMPQVAVDTKLKIQFTVKSGSKSATQDIVLVVRADKRPPVAIVEPIFVVMQAASTDPITISGLDSFVRSNGGLEYNWRVDTSKLSLVNSDQSSAVINVVAKDSQVDDETQLTLTVTDTSNGLSSTAQVYAKIRANIPAKPIFLDGQIEQTFDFIKRRFKPVISTGVYFDDRSKYAYDFAGVYVYEAGDEVALNGFGYDPNSEREEFWVTAAICPWNIDTESYMNYASCNKVEIGTSVDGFVDVSYRNKSALASPTSTWYALEIRAGSGDKLKLLTMPFQVRPQQITERPKARPIIKTIDSPSVGITEVGTDVFTGTFPDDGIFVVVNGAKSINPNGGGLKYQWETAFEQTAAEKLSNPAPQLFLLGKDREELMFFWPLSAQALKLKVSLKVFDEFTETPSLSSAVYLTVNQALRVPPVADPGVYPKVFVAPNATVSLELAAFGSYSPVGNPLSYEWTYLGFLEQNTVLSATNSVVVTATLKAGKHPFNLTVTDEISDLSASKFFVVEVEEKLVRDDAITYRVDGFVDAFPLDIEEGEQVDIFSQAFVSSSNPNDVIDYGLVLERININKKSENSVYSATSVAGTGLVTNFANPGEYVVEYIAWYDSNANGKLDNPADSTGTFNRKFVINVREKIKPMKTGIVLAAKQAFSEGNVSVPVTFNVTNDNSGTWSYAYRYQIFSASNPDVTVQYSLNGGTTTTSGAQTVSGQSNSYSMNVDDLAFGEYFVELEVKAVRTVGTTLSLRAKNSRFFRIVNSDLQVIVRLVDPEDSLNLNDLTLNVFAVADASTKLDGTKIQAIDGQLMTQSAGEAGVSTRFSLANPFDFGGVTLSSEGVSGIATLRGLLVQVYDNQLQRVEVQEYRADVPSSGEWYIDLIVRDRDVEIEGTYLSQGEFFSFENDEIFVDFENPDGTEREDIDLIVDEVAQSSTTGETTIRSVFIAGDERRVVGVVPFGQDANGVQLDPSQFFDRALSSAGNVSFDYQIFDNAITGKIFPKVGQLYLVEFPRQDGGSNYALMLITFTDEFGFAFRYAKATKTIPNISFGGGQTVDQIRLSMDFESGEFKAEGGVPGTYLTLTSSSNKGYVVSGDVIDSNSTDCIGYRMVTSVYQIDDTCVGKFDKEGRLGGYVDFLEEFRPSEGDAIEIIGYAYVDPTGREQRIDLPNPLRYVFREEKFGGFGLAYTQVVTGGEFHVTYFGDPDVVSATDPANYMIKTSDSFDGHLFKMMMAGGHDSVNIVEITQHTMNHPDLNGYLKFILNSDYLSVGTYLAVSASSNVTGTNGEEVERPRHVVTELAPFSVVKAPDVDTKWLEVREDDYGWRSEPYLKRSTEESSIRFEEFNPYGDYNHYREFVAWDYSDGIRFKGIGSYDAYVGERYFWETPQVDAYDDVNNTASEAAVYLVTNSTKVGETLTGEYRLGNDYGGSFTGQIGDFRPKVSYRATLLRVMPVLSRDGLEFTTSAEIRVVEEIKYPLFNGEEATAQFDQNNFTVRTTRFWFTDELGIVRSEREDRYVSNNSAEGNFIDHGYRFKTKITGYRKIGKDAIVVEGDPELLYDDGEVFTGYDMVTVRVDLGQGEPGANYKLLVLRESEAARLPVIDTYVETQLDSPENYFNHLPDSYASVKFEIAPTTVGEIIFRLLKYPQDVSAAADVPATAAIVAEQRRIIDGNQQYVELYLEPRREGEIPPMLIFDGGGFSFLAGDFVPADQPERDFAYLRQEFGNSVEMRLNPFLPDGKNKSNRRIKELGDRELVGSSGSTSPVDRMKNLLNGSTVSTAGLTSAANSMVMKPGKLYLYTGPGVESMKGIGKDRVLGVIAAITKDDQSLGFIYVIKKIGDTLAASESFKGYQLNNRLEFNIAPPGGGYEESVRIVNFLDFEMGRESYKIDFNLVGSPMDVMSAMQNGLATPDLAITVSDKGYKLAVLSSSDLGLTTVYELPRHIDIFGLGTALPVSILSQSKMVLSTTNIPEPRTFMIKDEKGNHVLFNVGQFVDYDDVAGGIQLVTRYFIDYVYLMDGNQAQTRFETYGAEIQARSMRLHDVALDFNLTGQSYQVIENAQDALIKMDGERDFGNYFVFAADPMQQDKLRGATVYALFNYSKMMSGTTLQIDRFDGQGHVAISEEGPDGSVELGMLDFGGFLNGNIQFSFKDDPEQHRGESVTITKLFWRLAGESDDSTPLQTAVNVEFRFNPDANDGFIPPDNSGDFQAFAARTGTDLTRTDFPQPYVEIMFTKELAIDSVEHYDLVRLEMRQPEYYHDDAAMDGSNDATVAGDPNYMMETYRARRLVIMPDTRKMRAYFPDSALKMITATNALMDLIIEADFNSSVAKGIVSTDNELLNFAYVRMGNSKVFAGDRNPPMFMPFNVNHKYVYQPFGGYQSDGATSRLTAAMQGTPTTFELVDRVNGKLHRHFEKETGSLEYCGESVEAGDCATLWNMGSTMGSGMLIEGGGYAVVRDVISRFYAGGLEYPNAVAIEVVRPDEALITRSWMVFAPGVGLVQHFIDRIVRETNEYKDYEGIELVGYKLDGQEARGTVPGEKFKGVDLQLNVFTPMNFKSPMTLTLYQRDMGELSGRRKLCYLEESTDSLSARTAVFNQIIFNDFRQVYLGAFSQANPCGVKPNNDMFNLIAELQDVEGAKAVRNIDLFTDMTTFNWTIDFEGGDNGGGMNGPVLFEADRFSFLMNRFLQPSANTNETQKWDMHVIFGDSGAATISVTNGSRKIRKVVGEHSFMDVQSFEDYAITTNGLANQLSVNKMSNQTIAAERGGLYLIKIPQTDRRTAIINKTVIGDVYVLLKLDRVDEFQRNIEFRYLIAVGAENGMVKFFNQPLNGTDPEFFDNYDEGPVGGDFGGAHSRQGWYIPMKQGECANFEVDNYNYDNFMMDERASLNSCANGELADLSVERLAVVTTAILEDQNEWRGRLEVIVNVPGGRERMPVAIHEIWNLPFAMHSSALPKADSATMVKMELPFSVRFNNGYCDGGLYNEKTYVGRENADGEVRNDFLFRLSATVQVNYNLGDSTSPYSEPTSITECIIRPQLNVDYQYFSNAREIVGLQKIPYRGDFNVTNKVHPAEGMTKEEVVNYADNSTDADPTLMAWSKAMRSLSASVLSTYRENWCGPGMENDPYCQGPARFRVGTNDYGLEHWGVAADFKVSGYKTEQPLHYRLEAYSMMSQRNSAFTTDHDRFGLGFLRAGYMDTAAGTYNDGTNMDGTTTDGMMHSGYDFSIPFDASTTSESFSLEETNDLWYLYDHEGPGGTVSFNGNTVIAEYIDNGISVREQGTFEVKEGLLYGQISDSNQSMMETIEVIKHSNLIDNTADAIVVLVSDDMNGNYQPELWFRSESDRNAYTATQFDALMLDRFNVDPSKIEEDYAVQNAALFINFGPEMYNGNLPFNKMEVSKLEFSIPLSRLSTEITVSRTLTFDTGYDNYGPGDGEGEILLDFDPSTQSEAFTEDETNGLWYTVSPGSSDGDTLEFIGNEFISTYSDSGATTKETGTFSMVEGYIVAQTAEGNLNVYKVDSDLTGSVFSELTSPAILVMMPDMDNEGKYEPEIWFRNAIDTDKLTESDLDSLMASFMSTGNGPTDPTDPNDPATGTEPFTRAQAVDFPEGDKTYYILRGPDDTCDRFGTLSGSEFLGVADDLDCTPQNPVGFTLPVITVEDKNVRYLQITDRKPIFKSGMPVGDSNPTAMLVYVEEVQDFVYRPEIWFENEQERNIFRDNGGWNTVFPGDHTTDPGTDPGTGGGFGFNPDHADSFDLDGFSSLTYFTLSGPQLDGCDGRLTLDQVVKFYSITDATDCTDAPSGDFEYIEVDAQDIPIPNAYLVFHYGSESVKVFKYATDVYNSQGEMIPATVVFFEEMVDGVMKYHPEVWFQFEQDRTDFITNLGWGRLFPYGGTDGGGSDDGGSTSTGSCDSDQGALSDPNVPVKICVTAEPNQGTTTDTSDYVYVFNSTALSLLNQKNPGNPESSFLAFELQRGFKYHFEINAPGHPFTLVDYRSREALDVSSGVTNNTTENDTIEFTVPMDPNMDGVAYRHMGEGDQFRNAVDGDEGHILIPVVFELSGDGSDYTFSKGTLLDEETIRDPNPLVLYRGVHYVFNSSSAHPFMIATDDFGQRGDDLSGNDGVLENGTAKVRLVIPPDANYDKLHFYCANPNHPGMFGTFQIMDHPLGYGDMEPMDMEPFTGAAGIGMVPIPSGDSVDGFAMSSYEITQGQWKVVMEVNDPPDTNAGLGDNLPVYSVSWDDITTEGGFLDRLNQLNQKPEGSCDWGSLSTMPDRYDPEVTLPGCYRLPSSAEWEHAARGGTNTTYSWGDNAFDAGTYAVFNGTQHSEVGSKEPNDWGLYDTAGSVSELVFDADETDNNRRLVHGGDLFVAIGDELFLQPDTFDIVPKGQAGPGIGFRVLLVPDNTQHGPAPQGP